MASNTAFHGDRNLQTDRIVLIYRAVAFPAVDSRLAVPCMAEEDKILHCVNLLCGKRCGIVSERRQPFDLWTILLHRAMAIHALPDHGE